MVVVGLLLQDALISWESASAKDDEVSNSRFNRKFFKKTRYKERF